MATDTRPACLLAADNLRKNGTKLTFVICVGIALALIGIFLQNHGHNKSDALHKLASNHWLHDHLDKRVVHKFSQFRDGCKKMLNHRLPTTVMHILQPVVHYSGMANALINLSQIILLKAACRSFKATGAIIALSAAGAVISFACLVGAFAICKLMCISCIGIHHYAIIYLACNRLKLIKEASCPVGSSIMPTTSGKPPAGNTSRPCTPTNTSNQSSCSFKSEIPKPISSDSAARRRNQRKDS